MIRLLTAIAGTPSHQSGECVSLTPDVESAWVDAGLAEFVGHREAAVVPGAAEQAMLPRAKGRRRVR